MAVIYKSQNVDEAYSSQLEANLYYNDVLVPGVTCDDSFEEGPAGGYYVHKLNTSAVDPVAPGTDFSDEETSDTLIQIVLNNSFQKSKKVYNVQAAAMSADIKSANLADAQKTCRQGWMNGGLACLGKEAKTITPDSDNIGTDTPAKDKLIEVRRQIVEAKGHADVVMCSPTFYAKLLREAGKDFTPVANDAIMSTGNMGMYLGMLIIEANAMVQTAAKYYDYTGTLQTVDLTGYSFIMYAHETLSVVTNVDMARVVDSENFNGSKAQVEINTGYRVRNNVLTAKVA